MKNQDIRTRAKQADVRLWQIAQAFGMQDSNFSKLLRTELPQEKKEKIFSIIERLEKEAGE